MHFSLKMTFSQRHSFTFACRFQTPKEMYPEYPMEKSPKLWMITQVKGLKHRPYWEKEIMKEMGLYKVK